MAGHHDLSLHLDSQEVPLRHLLAAANELSGMLSEVAKAFAGTSRNPVDWIVEVEAGSVVLPLRGETTSEALSQLAVPEIAHLVVGGLELIAERPERPAYFNDAALEHAKSLSSIVYRGEPLRVYVTNGSLRAKLSAHVVANVEEVIGIPEESIGTIEGRLEALNVHGRHVFSLWDLIGANRVDCSFGKYVQLEEVLANVGKRVAVTGLLRTRPTGKRVSIEVRSVRGFPDEADLPSVDDVHGILRG